MPLHETPVNCPTWALAGWCNCSAKMLGRPPVDDKGLPPLPEPDCRFSIFDDQRPGGTALYRADTVRQIQRECFAAGMAQGRETSAVQAIVAASDRLGGSIAKCQSALAQTTK